MRIVCTIGDCNGVGLEVWAKALAEAQRHSKVFGTRWILIGHPRSIAEYVDGCCPSVKLQQGSLQIGRLTVELIPCQTYAPVRWGYPDPLAARQAWEALATALELARSGQADAIVTLPITKHLMHEIGWRFPGQTEYLAHPYPNRTPTMLFVAGSLRVALLTTHVPLRRVHSMVTPEALSAFVQRLHDGLSVDFGLREPKIALLGLNPHAGESGRLGNEERMLQPAIEELRRAGYVVDGPFAADSFFARQRWKEYDVTVAMYHDQGLIPFKLLARGRGVNVTLGLPFVRTSPDHGTAYDIAGKGIADHRSMYHALLLSLELAQRRRAHGLHPRRRDIASVREASLA